MYIYQVERDSLRRAIFQCGGILGGRVLDAGSGLGKKYKEIFKVDSVYVSLDINSDLKPDIVGSIDDIPVPDKNFDSIVSFQVLGDLIRPEKAIQEFRRVIKPGGMILITEGFMTELHGEPRDFWRFTPYGLSTLLEENGFQIVKVHLVGGFFSVITQMIMRFLINSLDLYNQKIIGGFFSKFFFIFGKFAIILDKFFNLAANKKFGMGVLVLAKALDVSEKYQKHE